MPLTFTGKIYIIFFVVKPLQHVRLAQLDRAFGYGPKGRGFESSSARLKKKEILLTQHLLFLQTCARGFEPPTFWSVAKRSIQLS